MKNAGTTRYHVIEVENVREDGKFPTVAPMQGMGVSLLKSSRGFAVYETKFAAGGSQSQHAHEKAFVIVRIDGTVENGFMAGRLGTGLERLPDRLAVIVRGEFPGLIEVGTRTEATGFFVQVADNVLVVGVFAFVHHIQIIAKSIGVSTRKIRQQFQ